MVALQKSSVTLITEPCFPFMPYVLLSCFYDSNLKELRHKVVFDQHSAAHYLGMMFIYWNRLLCLSQNSTFI